MPPILGASFHQQMVALDIDATPAVTAMTATNSLLVTVGGW